MVVLCGDGHEGAVGSLGAQPGTRGPCEQGAVGGMFCPGLLEWLTLFLVLKSDRPVNRMTSVLRPHPKQ